MSMYWGSLPRNKAPLRSNLLVKFLIAWKYVPIIRILLSKTKGTILKWELRWTYWDQEPAVKVVGGPCLNVRKSRPRAAFMPPHHLAATQLAIEVLLSFEHAQLAHVVQWSSGSGDRPKAVTLRKEREGTGGRERGRKKKKRKRKKEKKIWEWAHIKPRLETF